LIDTAVIAVSLWLAYLIRFDGDVPAFQLGQCLYLQPLVIFTYLASKRILGLHRQVWHFFGPRATVRTILAVLCAANLLFVGNVIYAAFYDTHRVPIGVSLIHPLLVTAGWTGTRFLRRAIYLRRQAIPASEGAEAPKRLLLVGAGQAGVSLVHDLRSNRDLQIVGFVDDNPALRGRMIEGLPVLGKTDELKDMVERHKVDQVTLCMPSAPATARARVAETCGSIGVDITTVPTLSEILLGKLEISRLRPVRMEDLTCRSCVAYSP